MTWQTVCLNNIQPTPWRNGGGTTRELVAWPDSVAWQWRASVAEVVEPGPFSSFAGVQRWFAVLQGDGVGLTIDGKLHKLTVNDQPLAFEGSSRTTCELLGSTTQDFNLMVRHCKSARMLRVKGAHEFVTNAPKIIAAYAHNTSATVQFGSEKHELLPFSFGWKHVLPDVPVKILAANVLFMEIDL